jgi:hypothetical protein
MQRFECGLCGVAMTPVSSSASPIRYYHCPSCSGWCASPYRDQAVRSGTVRPAGPPRSRDSDASFQTIKGRLEEWLKTVDASAYETAATPESLCTVRPKTNR